MPTRQMAKVADHMKASPPCIGSDKNLVRASRHMARHGTCQLPVLDGRQLVGLLSDRDISLAVSIAPSELANISVEQVMAGVPLCTAPEASLRSTVQHMVARGVPAVVVMDTTGVVGLLTACDTLQLLAELLESEPA